MQSRRSQCFRKLPRFLHFPLLHSFALAIQPHFPCPSKKKSIWLCKVQLGPQGEPANCRAWMRGLQRGQEESSRPVPQAVSRTDQRTRGPRPLDCPSPQHLALFLCALFCNLGSVVLSEAGEINSQVERLKSLAPEAGATLLRAQQTNTSLRTVQLDE